MLQLTCECGRKLQVDESYAGRRGRCKSCGRTLEVPKTTETLDRHAVTERTRTTNGTREIPTESLRAHESVGQFLVLRKLGEGAMGEVWLAKDELLDRVVAIKVLPDDLRCDPDRLQRFEREAKLMAKLHHPHAVTVHHFCNDNNLLYLVMEHVSGGSLEDRVQATGALPWRVATRAIRDAASGLAEAHRLGLIHRDIKPANLLQTADGVTKVGDFGLARPVLQETQLTQQGGILGTPSYMAPEQWDGKPADVRSDIYALICSYYFLLTGKRPYDADNWLAMGLQHKSQPFPDPRETVPDIPSVVAKILAFGSQKNTEKRYQTADELIADLDDIQLSASKWSRVSLVRKPAETQSAAINHPGVWFPPQPRVAWIAAGLIALLILFGVVFFMQTPHGMLRIEVNDPQIEVLVDGSKIALLDQRTQQPLKAGSHQLAVMIDGVAVPLSDRAEFSIDGQSRSLRVEVNATHLQSDKFEVVRNEISVVTIRLTRVSARPSTGDSAQAVTPDSKDVMSAIAEIEKKNRETIELGNVQEKSNLAQELLQLVEKQEETPARRLAAVQIGGALAIEVAILDKLMAACDLLGKQFQHLDALTLKVNLLLNSSSEHHAEFATHALRIGFRCLALERFEDAEALAKSSQVAAKKSGREDLVYQATFLSEECLRVGVFYAHAKNFEPLHKQDPADLTANFEMGKYYCFAKNDWKKGLPLIASSKHPLLSTIAATDLEQLEVASGGSQAEIDGRLMIADQWWDIADKIGDLGSVECRQRAKYWYLKALGQSNVEQRLVYAKRVVPRIDSVFTRPVIFQILANEVHAHRWIRISNDAIEAFDAWRPNGAPAINQINHMQMEPSFRQVNVGQSYYFPFAIDFSTIDIRHEWGGRWGQIHDYHFGPDLLQINMEHGPNGGCDFGFLVAANSSGFSDADRFTRLWDVAFYTWQSGEDELTEEGWSKIIGRDPVDRQKWERLIFRAINEQFSSVRAPSPKLHEMQRWDYYAIVATREWDLPAGQYEIRTSSDDGIRVLVDGKRVVDRFTGGPGGDVAQLKFDAGKHLIRVEYFEVDKPSWLTFSIRRIGDSE